MKKIKNVVNKLYWHTSVFIAGLLTTGLSLADEAEDPLAISIKPKITALFGAGSTVSYAIYIGEIILGAVGYIKSKNPMILLGVPILVLFTHGMFTYISS